MLSLFETMLWREGKIDWIITHVHYPNIPTGYCSSMMSYCCADGNVGLREEIEGTERYKSLEAGKSCVDSFMTEVNKYVEFAIGRIWQRLDLCICVDSEPRCTMDVWPQIWVGHCCATFMVGKMRFLTFRVSS